MLAAVDADKDLVQVPVVTKSALSSLQSPSIARAELLTPSPDRLMGDDDAPLGKKILNIAEAQA